MAARQRGGSFLREALDPDEVYTPEDLPPEPRAVANAARDYVVRQVVPCLDALEHHDWPTSRRLIRQAGELGFAGIEIPAAHGGLELDKLTATAVAQELGASASFAVTFMVHAGIGTLPIVYFGTPEQKQRYLPLLASGELIGAYSLTETGSGSDALGARALARLDPAGEHYVISGTKQWTSNAGFADVFVLFAKVDGEHFTAFLVDRALPGVSIGPEERKMGLHGSSTAQVILNEVRVPVGQVLHYVGKGHQVAFNMLNLGRFKLGAVCVGACHHLLDVSARYALERHQFGRAIATFPLIQQKLAAMAVRAYASESVVYRTAKLLDDGLADLDLAGDVRDAAVPALAEYAIECSIVKILTSEALSAVADEGVQLHGGYGFMQGYDVERAYRDSRINRIFEGTNEINRLLIPQTLLRRAQRGEFPMPDLAKISANLRSQPVPSTPESPLAREQQVVTRARDAFWLIAGLAMKSYGPGIEQEQEILAASADVALEVFAMESVVARATRAQERLRSEVAGLHLDLARSYVAGAARRVDDAVSMAIAHLTSGSQPADGPTLAAPVAPTHPIDTIASGRRIASAILASEGWPLTD